MTLFTTLTMNPALDLSTAVDRIAHAHKMRCEAPQVHAGGGGINVARVLVRLGETVRALFPCGGPTGDRLMRLLAADGVVTDAVAIAGDTRESFTVRELATGHELRFVLPGPTLSETEWQACLGRLRAAPAGGWWIASGSLPPGVPTDFFARLARIARAADCRLVLDTSGDPLRAALEEGVYLVKPSLREMAELTGAPLETLAQQRDAAGALVARGSAKVVALSLGAQGALLATAGATLHVNAPEVPVVSTVGAGDSFLAALVASLPRQTELAEAFRTAAAAGAAALLSPGTALCLPADIQKLRAQVTVRSLA
jgi:6-phosphofructokinase 2